MKKLFISLLIFTFVFTASQVFAGKWAIYFKDTKEVIKQDVEGGDILGYRFTKDYILTLNQVTNIGSNGLDDYFIYLTSSNIFVDASVDWDEFLGFGYLDMALRVIRKEGNVTETDLDYVINAQWNDNNERRLDNLKDWKDKGEKGNAKDRKIKFDTGEVKPLKSGEKPDVVQFLRGRDILGVNLH
ncbi:MAG: hypothetical protein PF440_12125 [Thiomicrorhabdus sp.]|jgi:hypothetical protein|nr:hypothetical protein [Thiomicrorhabdus sp.]